MLHGEAIIYISRFTQQNYGYNSIQCEGTNLWDSIPEDLKNTKSQYSIKKKSSGSLGQKNDLPLSPSQDTRSTI